MLLTLKRPTLLPLYLEDTLALTHMWTNWLPKPGGDAIIGTSVPRGALSVFWLVEILMHDWGILSLIIKRYWLNRCGFAPPTVKKKGITKYVCKTSCLDTSGHVGWRERKRELRNKRREMTTSVPFKAAVATASFSCLYEKNHCDPTT